MSEPQEQRTREAQISIAICAGVSIPFGAVLIAYWFAGVPLPTLMFISFVALYVGGFFCYPFVGEEGLAIQYEPGKSPHERSTLLRVLGGSSGVGALLLFLVRLWQQGDLFTWM